MFNLFYISTENRHRIIELNKKLSSSANIEERQKIYDTIHDLESKKKPLQQCSLEECMDFKLFLIEMINKLGKNVDAIKNMKISIELIEERIEYLEKLPKDNTRKSGQKNEKSSNPRLSDAEVSNKWSPDLSDFD